MSKNLTRKGLALGAIVALGTSLFAGAPAFAGVESSKITLAPNAGTTYTSIVGATFSLKTELDATLASSGLENKTLAKLSYLVTNSSAANLTFTFDGGAGSGAQVSWDSADLASDITGTFNGGTSVQTTKKAVVLTGSVTNYGGSAAANVLTVKTTSDATDAISATVQAWIDDNSNGKIDTFELTSPARTINWVQASAVTATTTITSATIGTSTLKASVVLGNGINMENLNAGDVKVGFTKAGSAIRTWSAVTGLSADSVDVADTAYVSADAARTVTAYTNNNYNTGAVISAAQYVAQAYFQGNSTKLGAASSASVPANNGFSADSTDTLEVTASANVLRATPSTTTNATTVRTGYTGNVTFTSKVTYHSTDGTEVAVGAGSEVKVTLSNSALASTSSFVAGGKTLTSASGDQTFTVKTAADGTISFTGAGTGAKGDAVVVKIQALKVSGGYAAVTGQNTVTWADAATTSFVNTDLSNGSSSNLKIVKGSTYTLNYVVADQFGQALAAKTYRAQITTSNGTAAFTYYATASAGKISQAIVDNATANGSYSVVANLYVWNATTAAWDNTGLSSTVAVLVNSDVAADVSASAASSSAVATIAKTLVNADLRVDNVTNTQALIGYGATGTKHTISGTVTQASGAVLPGAVVTITGAGLGFVVNSGSNAVYSVGSATINTGSAGTYSVDVYSTAAGKQTVVVTSGAATKSVVIEYSGITSMAETNVLSLDVASLSQVGRSVTVNVKLVDKYGNAVDTADGAIAIAVTGVGSLSAATVGTDSTGKATVQFVAGANDFGDAVITAKYTATDAAATVVSATKTITVGVTDAQVDVVKNRVTAVASFSKGKTVGFYVDGIKKWSKLSASDADVVLNYNLKKGRHTVTVKISGGFVTTEVIVVK